MQAAATRYGWIVLVFSLLSLPIDSLPAQVEQSDEGPFLSRVSTELQGMRVLSAVGIATPVPTAATQGDPGVVPASTQVAEPPPASPLVVIVREGQSLWSLAAQYETSVESIVAANGLGASGLIRAGSQLIIPGKSSDEAKAAPARRAAAKPKPGTRLVAVRIYEGQTLWDVSQAYGVSVEEIVAVNGLTNADFVRAGQRVMVPVDAAAMTPRRVAAAIAESASSMASSAMALAEAFIWPARGRLTSGFGWRRWRHHDGIDIAAPYGSPITAARDGVVIFAGWYQAYGKTIILDHGGGLRTLYGHASTLLVRRGEVVKKGDLIAKVGSTGHSTGPHLHFEVRINGRAVNPMKYL